MAKGFTTYCVRVHAGLENVVTEQLKGHLDFDIVAKHHRTIILSTNDDPQQLLELRSVDDVFVLIGRFKHLDNTRNSLRSIHAQASSFSFNEHIEFCAGVRALRREKGFTITASFLGKRNYNRWEIADSIRHGASKSLTPKYLDRKNQAAPDHDIHFRVHLEDDGGWCGIRLSKEPLAKRAYKQEHIKGSLAPQIAYVMVQLAEPQSGELLLDPMCGAGTIIHEALCSRGELMSLGVDISPHALCASRKNFTSDMNQGVFMQGDARVLPLKNSSVACIVCDLPWGLQTELRDSRGRSLHLTYTEVLREYNRILTAKGRMVLLTAQQDLFERAATDVGLAITQRISLSLFGRYPTIFVLNKNRCLTSPHP